MNKRGKSQTLSLTPDTKLKEIIRALWRESYALYSEKYNRAPELDQLGQEIDPLVQGSIAETVLHGLYLGQDNLIEGNRSAAIGQGLNTKSLLEIVLGTYNTIPSGQNPDEWIPTDLLISLGNGTDTDNRSNVFEIYKNGIFKLLNAFQLGKWEPGVQGTDPENGTFQWTPENGLEEWRTDQWESFTGATGLSAYQIAVNNGFTGTEIQWLESLKGDTGEQGIPGADGVQGTPGPEGPQGIQGATGPDGAAGPAGADGAAGPAGANGPQGPAGADGADGANGTLIQSGGDLTPPFTPAWEGMYYLNAVTSTLYGPIDSGGIPANTLPLKGADGAQGIDGADGAQGIQGIQGAAGPGLAAGGTTGQKAVKKSNTDYDTQWVDDTATAAARVLMIKVMSDNATVTDGNGKMKFPIPLELNGLKITKAEAAVTTASSAGVIAVGVYNYTAAKEILSTGITIDVGEFTSYTATVPSVVNAANNTVATGDLIGIDVDAAGINARGLTIILTF